MATRQKLIELAFALEQEIGIENDVEMPTEVFTDLAHQTGLAIKSEIVKPLKIESVVVKPSQRRNYLVISRGC